MKYLGTTKNKNSIGQTKETIMENNTVMTEYVDDEESKADPSFDTDLRQKNEKDFKNVLLSSIQMQNNSRYMNSR